jgi:chromosome segregation ATPase
MPDLKPCPFCGGEAVVCGWCRKNFGPVRELIEAKEDREAVNNAMMRVLQQRDDAVAQIATLTRERDEARGWAEQRLNHIHLCQMAKTTLTCERDEAVKERDEQRRITSMIEDERTKAWVDLDAARARIAELEKATAPFTARDLVVHANGTWEWRKV